MQLLAVDLHWTSCLVVVVLVLVPVLVVLVVGNEASRHRWWSHWSPLFYDLLNFKENSISMYYVWSRKLYY
jgi:hypothetical protein